MPSIILINGLLSEIVMGLEIIFSSVIHKKNIQQALHTLKNMDWLNGQTIKMHVFFAILMMNLQCNSLVSINWKTLKILKKFILKAIIIHG